MLAGIMLSKDKDEHRPLTAEHNIRLVEARRIVTAVTSREPGNSSESVLRLCLGKTVIASDLEI